jgi:DNA-binding transcriptional MerR regulator
MSGRASSVARYPIRAVSKLTGIAIDTLRAWERRHAAVAPVRDERGRTYTEADVARLRLLHAAVTRGHGIGRVAALSDEQLHTLATAVEPDAPTPIDPARRTSFDTAPLIAALRSLDTASVDHELARLAAVLRPMELLDTLVPVLAQVGDDWYHRRGSIAQEHVMSSAVRTMLGLFLRLYSRANAPTRLLFATPAGERHELGSLGAAMLAASSGLGVAYVGPDLPASEIVDSARHAGARVLVLGLTVVPSGKADEHKLRTIVRDLPQEIELWAGGRGAERSASIIAPRGIVLRDFQAYQQELVRIGGLVR